MLRLLSWGFVPYDVLEPWSQLTPGLPHPVRCAFRFSQPPSALLLQGLPVIFQTGNVLGVRPSELFPRSQPESLLNAQCLHAVTTKELYPQGA